MADGQALPHVPSGNILKICYDYFTRGSGRALHSLIIIVGGCFIFVWLYGFV